MEQLSRWIDAIIPGTITVARSVKSFHLRLQISQLLCRSSLIIGTVGSTMPESFYGLLIKLYVYMIVHAHHLHAHAEILNV